MTTTNTCARLEQRREDLLKQLHGLGNLMRGSLVQTPVKCGRRGCECETGQKHVKVHLSLNLNGRTRGCYVGRERHAAVAELIAEYHRAWDLINALSEVNLELLRGEHPGGRARKKTLS